MSEVEYAEPDGVVRAHFTPNDERYNLQWHLKMIGAERMWDIQKGDPSVAVAVLDTGVAYEDFGPFRKAPDFGGTVFLPGFNVFTRDTHANDDNFHGTHVASTIAEATNNGIGASGIAYQSAIMPVKVLDSDGFGSNSGIAEGDRLRGELPPGGREPGPRDQPEPGGLDAVAGPAVGHRPGGGGRDHRGRLRGQWQHQPGRVPRGLRQRHRRGFGGWTEGEGPVLEFRRCPRPDGPGGRHPPG